MPARVPFKMIAAATRNLLSPSILTAMALAVLVILTMVVGSSTIWAQSNPLPLGTVSLSNRLSSCPSGLHGSLPLPQAVCYTATVSGCSSHQTGVVIPSLQATVAVSTPPSWTGTIFLHGGGTGEDYFDAKSNTGNSPSYANQYYNAGFQVVQIAWVGSTWSDNANDPAVKVMKYEACRPATLLNFVYNHFNGGASGGAMCAQGHSAGSGAMAFALAWYGAGSYLNDVVLTSGPVYANIEAGCQFPYATQFKSPITVCPTGQLGCVGSSWTDAVQYVNDGTSQTVAKNTNATPGNCNNYTGSSSPTTSYNQNWLTMSVTSSGASYSYPTTSLYAFLCKTGQSQNNSAGQGQLFYKNFTSSSQTLNYAVYGVTNCGGDEMIWDGTTSDGSSAFTVSADAMINSCVK